MTLMNKNVAAGGAGIFHRIALVYHTGLASFEREVGMQIARCRILLTVRENGGCTQKYLTECIPVDPASIARQLHALETDGYVRRRSDPKDRRRSLVVLTEAGEILATEVSRRRDAFLSMALTGLNDRDRTSLIENLSKISANLDEWRNSKG